VIKTLARHRVEFVLVGGLASQARGATRLTADIDVCPRWTMENLGRLASALAELGAEIKIEEGSIETLAVPVDAKTISNLEIGTWRTSAGDVDILLGIPRTSRVELARYEELMENASVLDFGRDQVAVASLTDLIRSKEVSDRIKDREALSELRDLRAQEAGRERGDSRGSEPPDLGLEL
jgi:hypothetical protein